MIALLPRYYLITYCYIILLQHNPKEIQAELFTEFPSH